LFRVEVQGNGVSEFVVGAVSGLRFQLLHGPGEGPNSFPTIHSHQVDHHPKKQPPIGNFLPHNVHQLLHLHQIKHTCLIHILTEPFTTVPDQLLFLIPFFYLLEFMLGCLLMKGVVLLRYRRDCFGFGFSYEGQGGVTGFYVHILFQNYIECNVLYRGKIFNYH
jgi:hypothetical protein